MTEVDDFLAAVLPRQHAAETALLNGDAGPRRALWSEHDPVTLFDGPYWLVLNAAGDIRSDRERGAVEFQARSMSSAPHQTNPCLSHGAIDPVQLPREVQRKPCRSRQAQYLSLRWGGRSGAYTHHFGKGNVGPWKQLSAPPGTCCAPLKRSAGTSEYRSTISSGDGGSCMPTTRLSRSTWADGRGNGPLSGAARRIASTRWPAACGRSLRTCRRLRNSLLMTRRNRPLVFLTAGSRTQQTCSKGRPHGPARRFWRQVCSRSRMCGGFVEVRPGVDYAGWRISRRGHEVLKCAALLRRVPPDPTKRVFRPSGRAEGGALG